MHHIIVRGIGRRKIFRFDYGKFFRTVIERSLETNTIHIRKIEFFSIDGLRRCLTRGLGVTICPEIAIATELADGRLCKLAWESDDAETPILMIWHADKWRSPLLRAFMAEAESVIGDGARSG